jgi:hypothetical protein
MERKDPNLSVTQSHKKNNKHKNPKATINIHLSQKSPTTMGVTIAKEQNKVLNSLQRHTRRWWQATDKTKTKEKVFFTPRLVCIFIIFGIPIFFFI